MVVGLWSSYLNLFILKIVLVSMYEIIFLFFLKDRSLFRKIVNLFRNYAAESELLMHNIEPS